MTSDATDPSRVLVERLVERSGIPASPEEVAALVAAAPAVDAAVRRLYAVALDHETAPAVVLEVPD